MRLSTNTIFAQGTQSILDQQARLTSVGLKESSGQRINKPSDDPSGAAELVSLQDAQQVNTQYSATRDTARTQLSAEENQLNQASNALVAAKQALVRAGNGTLSNADRTSVANTVQNAYQQLLSAANAKDSDGNYIFSGNRADTQPFSGADGDLTYQGDDGQRKLQVSASRQIAVNDTGSAVFASTTDTAKTIATAAASNQGTATYSALSGSGQGIAPGTQFKLSFAVDGGNTTYSVTEISASGQSKTLAKNLAYTSGDSIKLGDSLQTVINGKPAAGDSFNFAKGAPQDSNILNALANAAKALRQPVNNATDQARLTNTENRANRQVDNALDNVLAVRAHLGTNMSALDQLDDAGDQNAVNLKQNISDLRDANLPSTVSEFSLAKLALEAAQQTFVNIQGLSLFNKSG